MRWRVRDLGTSMRPFVAALIISSVGLGGGSAGAVPITGISDQNMAPAPGLHSGWSATANNVFAQINVPHVRYITSWEVAAHKGDNPCGVPCQRYNELVSWVSKAQSLGKRVLISFGDPVGCTTSAPCPAPTLNAYGWGINIFLQDPAFANVREFTAWNEPNRSVPERGVQQVVPSSLAANYWKELNTRCQAKFANTCTVVAGDFSEANLLSYSNSYRSTLTSIGANPGVWAAHPYGAVDSASLTSSATQNFRSWIDTRTDGEPVWITEVGAIYCKKGDTVSRGPNAQNADASFLKNTLLPWLPARVQRTYYYFLAKPAGTQELCPDPDPNKAPFDTALLGAGDAKRPALYTLFPSTAPPPPPSSCPGWHAGGDMWYLSNTLSGGPGDVILNYGLDGDIPVVGDWNGDGIDTPGVFRGSIWYMSNTLSATFDIILEYGLAAERPVAGDWNGDGTDTPGVYRNGMWYFSNNFTGATHIVLNYGLSGDIPLAGDWNRDGIDTPGVNRGNMWYLSNSFGPSSGDIIFDYGLSGDFPIVGDWNGDGTDTPGIYRYDNWHLTNAFGGSVEHVVVYGLDCDFPIAGDWNRDGKDTPGVNR